MLIGDSNFILTVREDKIIRDLTSYKKNTSQ